jgi:hypothetical protein
MAIIRTLLVVGLLTLLAACGGGGGGGSSGSTTTTTPTTPTTPAGPLTNFTTLTVDGGPTGLDTGPDGYIQDNVVYASVTICAPGSTTNCQTIDHVQVDTGSVGLRIVQSVIGSSLLSALPIETDSGGNPVGECYGFVDGYVFGSVRQADFQIGGESVSDMPLQVIGDTGQFSTAPSSCSSGGGPSEDTVYNLGANGIIGIGVTTTDCGASCTAAGGYAAAIYYDCPASGCGGVIGRASSAAAPFQQLPNPVAAMSVDNNGSMISLSAPPAGGATTVSGTLYFGIGTETNNGLGSATVLTTTNSTNANGAGLITTIYNSQSLNESFLDSGSSLYVFVDNTIAQCTSSLYTGYYCPNSPLSLSATLEGENNVTDPVVFTLNNAQTLLSTTFSALPGVGGNPDVFVSGNPYPNSFDFGLPFFYGRNVYTGIEGRAAGSAEGPFFAF